MVLVVLSLYQEAVNTYPATESLHVNPVKVEKLLTSLRPVIVSPPRAVRRGVGGVRQAGLRAISGMERKCGSRSQAKELCHDGGGSQLFESRNRHVGNERVTEEQEVTRGDELRTREYPE